MSVDFYVDRDRERNLFFCGGKNMKFFIKKIIFRIRNILKLKTKLIHEKIKLASIQF